MKYLLMAASGLILCGCAPTVTVKPVDTSAAMKSVCLQKLSRTDDNEFVSALKGGFNRHGVAIVLVTNEIPDTCDTFLSYTAFRSWDFTTYLTGAELSLEKDGQQIGYAKYALNSAGGFNFSKWDGAKSKMDPVIDKLLQKYHQ